MRIGNFRRITRADHPDIPDWFEPIIDVLNDSMDDLYRVMRRNISLSENLHAQVKPIVCPHDKEIEVQLDRKVRTPIGVIMIYNNGGLVDSFSWSLSDSPVAINVTVRWVTTPDTDRDVTLLILGS